MKRWLQKMHNRTKDEPDTAVEIMDTLTCHIPALKPSPFPFVLVCMQVLAIFLLFFVCMQGLGIFLFPKRPQASGEIVKS